MTVALNTSQVGLVFPTRPISLVMLLIAAIMLAVVIAPAVRKKRETDFSVDD